MTKHNKHLLASAIFILFLASCISVNRADEKRTTLPQPYSVKVVSFQNADKGLTVGLANVGNYVCTDDGCKGSIKQNKEKILRVIDQLKEYKVNMILFPEFSLTGYFWGFDDVSNSGADRYNSKKTSPDCWNYMNEGVLDKHLDWLKVVQSKLNDSLQYIIFNSIRNGPKNGTQLNNKFLNSTYVIDENFNSDNLSANEESHIYDKTFLPGIEKLYTITGQRDFLIIKTDWGDFGFTTCYDMCFPQLYQEYDLAHKKGIDGIIQLASWRGPALRKYNITPKPIVNKNYYGFQWDLMASDRAATNQIWLLAANAVGHQKKGGYDFWGGSGIWAPSGIRIAYGPNNNGEELIVVENIPIRDEVKSELQSFDYGIDFLNIYKSVPKNSCCPEQRVKNCGVFTRWKEPEYDGLEGNLKICR